MTKNRQHRVVLTGGSGTLGRNFLDLIKNDESFEVLCLLRQDSRAPAPRDRLHTKRIDFDAHDVAAEILEEFKPTCFVHAAATGMNFPKPEWFNLIRFNVGVSLNFCESVSRHPACRFVFVSTGLVYREQGRLLNEDDTIDTLHPYGASKAAADILMRAAAVEFGVPITVLRPFSFTGLWDDQTRLFPSLLRAAAEGRPLALSPCDQIRDHCSARDIAEGIRASIIAEIQPTDTTPRVYNLGSGKITPLRKVIEDVVRDLQLNVKLDFGARPYSRYEPMSLAANIRAAGRDLGWYPRHNLAHAVWQLAHESFPQLQLQEPIEFTGGDMSKPARARS